MIPLEDKGVVLQAKCLDTLPSTKRAINASLLAHPTQQAMLTHVSPREINLPSSPTRGSCSELADGFGAHGRLGHFDKEDSLLLR